jgi:hypothetical protein
MMVLGYRVPAFGLKKDSLSLKKLLDSGRQSGHYSRHGSCFKWQKTASRRVENRPIGLYKYGGTSGQRLGNQRKRLGRAANTRSEQVPEYLRKSG